MTTVAIIPINSIYRRLWMLAAPVMRFAAYFIGREGSRREAVFAGMVRDHDAMIKRICMGYANSMDDFEDLRQDVLVNIWQGLPKFNGDSAVKTWIYRVALNTCVSSVRMRGRRVQTCALYDTVDVNDGTDEATTRIRELYEDIARLSALDKAIVMLWLDEYSYDEIAAMVGLNRNTVAARLHRAKEKLKRMA